MTDGLKYGFTIDATDKGLGITPPGGAKTIVSEPFLSKDVNTAPEGLIECSWDPTGTWVAIFIPQRRFTDLIVYDLKACKKLKQSFAGVVYPKWYGGVYATTDSPKNWDGATLKVGTVVKLRDSTTKSMPQTLTIAGNGFTLKP